MFIECSNLLMDRWINSDSSSVPTNFRLCLIAATPVVKLPAKGVKTKSFSFVDAKRILSKRGTGFWVECLPKRFSGEGDYPDAFHLFAAICPAHVLIMECVLGLFVFCRPENCFGRMCEVSTRQIGRRIRFYPSYIVWNFHFQLLHGKLGRVNYMMRPGNPNGSVLL